MSTINEREVNKLPDTKFKKMMIRLLEEFSENLTAWKRTWKPYIYPWNKKQK